MQLKKPGFELPDDNQFKNEKLKVLLVSVDFTSQLSKSVIPFLKHRGIKNEVFLLDEKDQQVYINKIDTSWSGSIPATVIKNYLADF